MKDAYSHLAGITKLLRRRFKCAATLEGGCVRGDDEHDAEIEAALIAAERFIEETRRQKASLPS